MPLPNADKDKRLYELLKTQDLENLSYADFKGAAEKIFVEGVNEDDLRRVVLIQLARMAVAGEWNGFTSSGGGGSASIDYGFGNVMNSSNQIWVASDAAPYGGSGNTTSTLGTNYQMCYPLYLLYQVILINYTLGLIQELLTLCLLLFMPIVDQDTQQQKSVATLQLIVHQQVICLTLRDLLLHWLPALSIG